MYRLSSRQKTVLAKKIKQYKETQFPGKGGGARLAGEIGVPPQTVSNWLSGKRLPTPMQLYRLAIAFNVSPLELCGLHKKKLPSRAAAEVSLLLDMLTILCGTESGHAYSHATGKRWESINSLFNQMMDEMAKHGKEGDM